LSREERVTLLGTGVADKDPTYPIIGVKSWVRAVKGDMWEQQDVRVDPNLDTRAKTGKMWHGADNDAIVKVSVFGCNGTIPTCSCISNR
jgi:hypothetical protein